jgi:nucleoporin POM152
MNGTPRLGSSYPSTPDSLKRSKSNESSDGTPNGRSSAYRKSLPTISQSTTSSGSPSGPLISLTLIDAPSQRFYVFAVYVALLGWRLYDWGKLVEDEADSLWLFIKWVAIDAVVFLYGLPALRVPWLEWSNPAITAIFFIHAFFNGMLMFRIPVSHDICNIDFANIGCQIPLEAFLAGLVKTMYDREISISENRVKPGDILHNSSLIMGKQIINILPEG